jgi:ribA/ribD-fused uncharacterized protein
MTIYFYRTKEKYGPFSNFSRHSVELGGKVWPTSEHYYQAKKFESEDLQEKIRQCKGPGAAAEMGRDCCLPLRQDWDEVKDDVMREVIRAKFTQHEDLKKLLVESGHEHIVEDSPVDWYWGCGSDRTGKNMLGRILMEIREELA